ncbi:hypothetical protein Dimus_012298 [Dionaea muscipula]
MFVHELELECVEKTIAQMTILIYVSFLYTKMETPFTSREWCERGSGSIPSKCVFLLVRKVVKYWKEWKETSLKAQDDSQKLSVFIFLIYFAHWQCLFQLNDKHWRCLVVVVTGTIEVASGRTRSW